MTGPEEGRIIPMTHLATLGRSSNATVCIADDDVSRIHATLTLDDKNGWTIKDAGSRNGTWINHAKIEWSKLRPGDLIALGARVRLQVCVREPIDGELRERRRLEMVGRLSVGVAHDFNNMLAAAMSNVESMRGLSATERGEPAIVDCIEDAYLSLQRAGELAARLLQMAKGEKSENVVIDATKVCDEVLGIVRRTFPRSIRVESEVEAKLRILAPATALQQVLMNLCINARDAMPRAGVLRIDARRDHSVRGGQLVLSVSDTGTGMDEETKRRIFQPFFTTKREGRGFGLGLATVAEAVHQMGGTIEVTSYVGRGTRFDICLPATTEAELVTEQTAALEPRASEVPGAVVLLVDDDATVRRAVRRMLERALFSVVEAPDGTAAIELVRRGALKPSVAIVDFDMPGMSGGATCRALRALSPDLPSLILTGGSMLGQENKALESIAGLLRKPISGSELVGAIERAIAGKRPTPRPKAVRSRSSSEIQAP